MPPKPPSFIARLFRGGARGAREASAARLSETTASLRSGAPREVQATREFRQSRLALREQAQTTSPILVSPRSTRDEVALARQRSLAQGEERIQRHSRVRDPAVDAPPEPRRPLLAQETRSRLARAGAYGGLGLVGAGGAALIGKWITDGIVTPISENRQRELDLQTPKLEDAGACAKIIRAPGQATLLDDAACRAERVRTFLGDPDFSEFYQRYFLGGGDPGGVTPTSLVKPPSTFADKAKAIGVAAVLLTLAGVGGYAAWRYVKAHPEKFRKKAGTRVMNPPTPKPGSPA